MIGPAPGPSCAREVCAYTGAPRARRLRAVVLCALLFCAFAAPRVQAELVINELMYHPADDTYDSEFVELYNRGVTPEDLSFYRFDNGIAYTFPTGLTVEAGQYLVVCVDTGGFQTVYPGVTNWLGPYSGRLDNGGERVTLSRWDGTNWVDADTVKYNDGATWPDEPDGEGPSLELVHHGFPNDYAEVWSASTGTGTPGAVNSAQSVNPPPAITEVAQDPAQPFPLSALTVTARLLAHEPGPLTVVVRYRQDASPPVAYSEAAMLDDGLHGDGMAGDGVYGCVLPGLADDAVLQFEITARDADGPPAIAPAGAPAKSFLCYFGHDPHYTGEYVTYHMLMTQTNRAELEARPASSNVLLDGTLVLSDGRIFYNCGIRYRGSSSRSLYSGPKSYRVDLPAGRSISGQRHINLNAINPVLQCVGMGLFRRSGIAAPSTAICRLRLNGEFLVQTGEPWLNGEPGGFYVSVEKLGGDFIEENYPDADTGSLYRSTGGTLEWLGTNTVAYTNDYTDQRNMETADCQDVVALCDVLNNTAPSNYPAALTNALDVDEWIDFFAVQIVLNNHETCIANTQGGDVFLYGNPASGQFELLPWDMDSVLDTSGLGARENDGDCFAPDTNQTIWMSVLPAVATFLRDPEIAPQFMGRIVEILETTFSADALAAELDALGGVVSAQYRQALLSSRDSRYAFVTNEMNWDLTAVIGPGTPVFEHGVAWRYCKGTQEPPSDWATRADATLGGAWATGPGGFGYGDDDDATVLSDMQNGYTTFYIRHSFVPGALDPDQQLTLRVDYDDGFVAYLNGTEVARANASGTPPAYNAVATAQHEAGVPELFSIGMVSNLLVAGTNVLAVQSLNANLTSSDSSLIVDLLAGSVRLGSIAIASGPTISLSGIAPQAGIVSVRAGGTEADWDGYQGTWQQETLTLSNGANRVTVEARDRDGYTRESLVLDVIVAAGAEAAGGTIWGSTNWAPASGVVRVTNALQVAASGVLTIESGTTVLIEPGASLRVWGELDVQGTRDAPVFLVPADATSEWELVGADADSSLTLRYAELAGAGVTVTNSGALLIEDSVLRDYAGYIVAGYQATNVTIRRSRFARFNETHFRDSPTEIEDSLFEEYTGDAVDCADTVPLTHFVRRITARHGLGTSADGIDFEPVSHAVVEDCLVYDVTDRGVSIGGGSTNVTVTGCVIYEAAGDGIGVKDGSWARIWNNTIVDCGTGLNLELDDGPGYGHAVTTNNIIWANGIAIRLEGSSTLSVAYSDIALATGAVYSGTGNINADPEFLDAAGRDYRLQAGSPCVATGLDGADMGALRPVGGVPAPPTELCLKNSSGAQVQVQWRDNSNNESRFEVERSTDGLRWTRIAAIAADATNHIDVGLAEEETYYYRVRAAHEWAASEYAGPGMITTDLGENTQELLAYLRLTEIMYHPKDEVSEGDGDQFEFLEFKNTGPDTLDLAGLYFEDGIDYTFPPGTTLGSNEFFVLARYSSAFAFRYPGVTNDATYGGSLTKLANDGERLRLKDATGSTVIDVTYAETWYPATDGAGYSLVPVDTEWEPDAANSWRASTDLHGSPGADDPALSYGVIVINEVLTHTDPPLEDAIELYNASASETVHIGGWYLSDNDANLKKFRVPNGTMLDPGDYVVFYEEDFNSDTNDPSCFEISSHGEEIWLSSADLGGTLTGYRTREKFGAAANGVSFGRHVRVDGETDFVATSNRTFGMDNPSTLAEFRTGTGLSNTYPRVGPVVINELMYHPAVGGDEFVELLNITGADVPLYDPANPSNTWRLGAAVDYVFPTNTVLSTNAYALVVGIAPSAFRLKYGIPAAVPVFGPYDGKLNNAGESVKLYRPDTPEADGTVPFVRVDRVKYNDRSPWPRTADGDGPSLERIAPKRYGNDPYNWTVGYPGGTPGAPNNVEDWALIARASAWRYRKGTQDASSPIAAWRTVVYDDSGWSNGFAPFGYGGGTPGTPLTDMSNGYTCVYLRRTFELPDRDAVRDITFHLDYDDGLVLWLNGQELLRRNVAGGVESYDGTAALSYDSGGYQQHAVTAPYGFLRTGTNVLAVQAFNVAITNRDFRIDAEMTCRAPLPGVSFASSASYASEHTSTAQIAVRLSRPAGEPVTVDYSVTGGSATGGVDYTLADGTLTFAVGATNGVLALVPNDDGDVEPDETVELTLSNAVNARLGATTVHTFTLFDNDSGFVAYNDLVWNTDETLTRITTYSGFSNQYATTGQLVDYPSGSNVDVTISVTSDVDWNAGFGTQGELSVPLTDGYACFNGMVGCRGVMRAGMLRFSDLAPSEMYTIAVFGNRAQPSYAALSSTYSLFGARSLRNESSEGTMAQTNLLPGDTVRIWTGYNTTNGQIAKFVDVVPEPGQDLCLQIGGSPAYANAVMISSANGPGLAPPDILPAGTNFSDTVSVTLSSQQAVAVIHYTTDGTTPTELSPVYSAPLILDRSLKLKARCMRDGYAASAVREAVFSKALRVVAFDTLYSTVNEGTSSLTVGVFLSLPAAVTVTADYLAAGGTATAGVDYSLPAGTLTFSPGQTTQTVFLTITNDAVREGDETVQLALTNVVNAGLGAAPVHTVTIADNDDFFVAYNDLSWAGGQTSTRITTYSVGQSGLLVDHFSGENTAVTLGVAGGSGPQSYGGDAAFETDAYRVFDGIVDCAGVIGYESTNLTLTMSGLEPTLRYEFVLFGNRDRPEYTDRTSTATISGAPSFQNESTPGVTITTTYLPQDTTVTCNGWNRENGFVTRFAQIDPGLDGEIQITVSDNASKFYANALMLRATSWTGGSVVEFAQAASGAGEPVTNAAVAVVLVPASVNTVQVGYNVTGGTAAGGGPGADYVFAPGVLTFDPGETNKYVTFDVVDDPNSEPNETVVFELTALSNAIVGWRGAHTYTITDDDGATVMLLAKGGDWKYDDTGTDLGTAWREPGYDDSLWSSGLAALGYPISRSGIVTVVSYGGNPSDKYITTYFRTDFTLDCDPAEVTELELAVNYDDAFVAYLNGQELARRKMPAGPPSFSTLATTVNGSTGTFETVALNDKVGLLTEKNNVLAVELHQHLPTSSDLFIDAELQMKKQVLPDERLVIERGSNWSWRKGTSEASAPLDAWRRPSFDASAWDTGSTPIGYGETGVVFGTELTDMQDSYSSVFARREFVVRAPELVRAMQLWVQYDDGWIAWLNGEEFARVNVEGLPGTPVLCDGLASNGMDMLVWSNVLERAALPPFIGGTNVLAVQIFNWALYSSDLVFDLEMSLVAGSAFDTTDDPDQDGMPDVWELHYLPSTAKSTTDDSDWDGISNMGEFIGGTDPTNPASAFAVGLDRDGSGLYVSMPTIQADGVGYTNLVRRYRLEKRTAHAAGSAVWEPVAPAFTNLLGTGATVVYTNTTPPVLELYRARVRLEQP